jgi:glucose-6-phosphate isomerase/transaldolase/glucose-6-phosphate isomerase
MNEELIRQIWAKNGAAWSDDPTVQRFIPTALGWLEAPEQTLADVGEIDRLAGEVRAEGYQDVFLLGMGGSSLCPEVLRQTFGSSEGHPRLTVLDTTHPDAILAAEAGVDVSRTLFLVASKSGGTIETASLFQYFFARVEKQRGAEAGKNFVALTDPGTSLGRLAGELSFRQVVSTPPAVGGRYSALTPFGMLPAALIGLDVRDLLNRAQRMAEACRQPSGNPGQELGEFMGRSALAGRDKITLVMPAAIDSFGLWVEQLLAESTGKEGKGLVPVAGEPLGSPGQYGTDRAFVQLRLASDADSAADRAVDRLSDAGHPVLRIDLDEPLDLAGEFFRWEFATAVAGALLRINAFDQPNVQESKDNTSAVLEAWKRDGSLPTATSATEAMVIDLIRSAEPGDYLALVAYVPASGKVDERLTAIRKSVRDGTKLATTFGYGPRFLHSTGQLHKGGPNTGVFVQIVSRPTIDLAIPGQSYGFATLIAAQALGDLEALETHGRRVVRLDLGNDVAGGLDRLAQSVESTTW